MNVLYLGEDKEKIKRSISWLLVIVIAFSLVTARIITAKADDNKELRILEIQPGNSFTIKGDLNLATTTPIDKPDTKDITSSGGDKYKAIIEHISMPEFIGKINQLNGKYDVIVIGRNTSGMSVQDRDYSGINNNGSEITGSIVAGHNDMLPNGNYVENDITKRKANEILDFINSGQLVYINTSVLSINNSNLKGIFSNVTKDNFIKYTSESNLSLTNILNKYLENTVNKRPNITVTPPTGDKQTDTVGNANYRNMQFLLNMPQGSDVVTARLFLDMNGDGVFSEKECYKKETNVPYQQNYKLTYDIGTQFFGLLYWKVEIEKINGVKSYATGNIYFKSLKKDYKKNIRVLQVNPDNGLDLSTNSQFKTQMNLKDYTVTITNINASYFNTNAGNTLKLNGNYDMVIIGFYDSYNGRDITNTKALDELQNFIKSGQSVMFTHDTMALRMDSSSTGNASQKLTSRFRDFVGQSRFLDKYRTDGKQTDAYEEYNSQNGTYEERTIPHIDLGSNNNKIIGYTLNGKKNQDNTMTTTVYKTNAGLISMYPYQLGDISVATTHDQWYQLNLEDPDVVPWYNLKSDGKVNRYDSRNNYYTYSKGNITYSGTGHSSGYSDDEFRLFVNTMIKAERGANHAPTITGVTENGSTEVDAKSDYNFNIIVKDLDADKVRVNKVVVGGTLNSDGKLVDNTGTIITQKETEYAKEGTTFPISVNSSYFSGKIGQNINITVQAQDIRGALSEKTYQLKPINTPMISIQDTITKSLVGDKVPLIIRLDKLNDDNNQINNISVENNQISTAAIDINNLSIINQQNSYYLTGELTTNTMVSGEYIEIKINYNVGSTQKQAIAKTIVSSNNSEIKLKIEDINGNPLNVDTNATLSNSNNQWDNTVISALKGSVYTWPDSSQKITSDNNYNLKLDTPEGYKINSYTILNDKDEIKASGIEATTSNFVMNYDNPKAQIIYKVGKTFEDDNIDSTINILEVEPANSFKITNQNAYVKTGIESTTVKLYDNTIKQVHIDHISMPEFVGKIDKLNGKYDVIVIGRYTDTTNITSNKNKDQLAYIDYNNTQLINNDITNRKADEILDFIRKGQLVYIDNSIVNSDSNIKDLNLYKKFSSLVNDSTDNCNAESTIQQLSLTKIANDYIKLDDSYKNINFSVSSPQGDSSDATTGDPSKRNMEFNISLASSKQEVVNVNLYLDIDGDGLYELQDDTKKQRSEFVKSLSNIQAPQNNIKLQYQMPSDFVGYLSWKVEVVKSNGIKSYTTGDMQYRSLTGERIPIKVLQVSPYSDSNLKDKISGNLNLGSTDKDGNARFNFLLSQLKDYNITVDVMSIDEFNGRAGKTDDQLKNTQWSSKGSLVLNGNYQMIIFGFADCYGNYDFSQNSCTALKDFINTGQGVLFTHDTIAPYFNGTNRNDSFRTLAGQTDIRTFFDQQSAGYLRSQTKTVYQTNSALITNYPFDLDENINIRRTHGQYYQLNLEDENVVPWYTGTPNTVTYTGSNKDYKDNAIPQNIKDELTSNGLTETDMTRDDYNSLSDTSEINQYDVKNNYYTYSVGNITFSGTAENSRENYTPYPDTELKLFVNTISKAIRGANHAPTLQVLNLDDQVSKYQEGFDFQVIPSDLDNDLMNIEIKIERTSSNNDDQNNWEDVTNLTVSNSGKFENIKSGTVLPIDILQSVYYHNGNKYKYLRVTVTATDEHGAKATQVQKEIEITDTPLLSVKLNSDDGYLIGDNVMLKATVKPPHLNNGNGNGNDKDVSYSDIHVSLDYYSNGGALNLTSENSDLTFTNIDSDNSNEQVQSYNFKITNKSLASTDKAEVYNISANYKYVLAEKNEPSDEITGNINKAISVRKGEISVTAKGINGVNLGLTSSSVHLEKSGQSYTVDSENITVVDGKVIFDNIPSGTYDVYIDSIEGYDTVDHKSITINYNQNIGIVEFDLAPAVRNIQHGLYENVDSGSLSVDAGQAELARGAIANLAVGCDIASSNVDIKLQVNKNVDAISDSNPIKIYKIINDNGQWKLDEVSGASYSGPTVEGDYNSYAISLPPGINSETKLVIRYQCQIPTDNNITGSFENNVIINREPIPFRINISSKGLPDLF